MIWICKVTDRIIDHYSSIKQTDNLLIFCRQSLKFGDTSKKQTKSDEHTKNQSKNIM